MILPIAAILTGVVLELNSLHLIGDFIPNDLLFKIWPVVLIFVALDLVLSQRRLIGAAVVLFVAAALLSTQYLEGGTENEVWKTFMKVWPILLILFGVDWIFSGKSLINKAVIIAGVIILVYVLFIFLDVPVLKKLPFEINLQSILPTSEFNGTMPMQQTVNNSTQMFSRPSADEESQDLIVRSNGEISAAMPGQNAAAVRISAASGKVSVQAGSAGNLFMSGLVQLDRAEKLSENADLNGSAAQYSLTSSGHAAANNTSDWNLSLTPQRNIDLNITMNNGYVKADLRLLNLSSAVIENKYGPVDVMVPNTVNGTVKVTSSNGDIRIYIPGGTAISASITGTNRIEYPQYSYLLSDGVMLPRGAAQNPVRVEVHSNNGLVKIIETAK